MQAFYRFSIMGCILLLCTRLQAQNITGTWEGIMSDEYIRINIEQRKDELCGFTYDYVLRDKKNHCKAKAEGYYDRKSNTWFLSGTRFIENSGSHVLMRIRLWRNEGDPKNVLQASVTTRGLLSSLFNMAGDEFEMTRASAIPEKLPEGIAPCFPEKPKPAKPAPKPIPVKRDSIKPQPSKPLTAAPVKKDTVKRTIPKPLLPIPVKKDSMQLLQKMAARKQSEQSRLVIDVDHINLKLYDNGIVDNDTVSVFYNGKLLVSHQRLSEKPVELDIQLDESTATHEITMYAENLGSIPPNTAVVIVTAGSKRYELHSKASLEENAVLVFEYRKKE